VLSAGDALLIPSGPQGSHLFIVLNDPARLPGYGNAEHCVLANISSIKPNIAHDQTCLVAVGMHPFVTQPSFVYYRGIRVESIAHLQKCLDSGVFGLRPPPFPLLFVREIIAGLDVSRTVNRGFRGLL
jgi:hypothetical protein